MPQHNKANIYLIGYRCTGKTSVGKLLAAMMDKPFVDADVLLEKEAGKTIAQLVEQEGWEGFRKREKELLARLAQAENHVIAPGGGIVLDPENVALMKGSGLVAWLRASEDVVASRMAQDGKTAGQRPSLTGVGVLEEIRAVMEKRQPLYQAAADLEVDTGSLSVPEVCARILAKAGFLS